MYQAVCKSVASTVIDHKGIMKLTDLTEQYIQALSQTSHPNLNYRSENLRTKLEKTYPESLTFVTVQQKGAFQSTLVYSSIIDSNMLIQNIYDMSSLDCIKDVSLMLRKDIISAYKEAPPLSWPPTAQQFEEISYDVLPKGHI